MNESERPTHVRYQVVGLATVAAVLLYLDRLCVSFLEGYISDDLGLDRDQGAFVLGVFFAAYALGQVPSGWLSDRYGARGMLALYILLWSVFTGMMGLAATFLAMVLLRVGCGLAQAGAYPTGAAMVGKWVPFRARGLASAIVSTGGRLGGAAAPVLTAYLLVAFVPVNASALLSPDDLLDPEGFRERLAEDKNKPADRLAKAMAAVVQPQTQSASFTVEQLNEVLKRRDLYERINPDEFKLTDEARRVAGIPGQDLTQSQVVRRNRLLLEAAFPEHFRKFYGRGWRPTVLVYGLAGVLVAGWFWLSVRDRPEEHPRCNAAERKLIEDRPAAVSSPKGRAGSLPWRAIVENGSLWCSALSQFGTNFGWLFLVTLLPRYLDEAHGVPVVERGWLSGLPILVGMAGMLAGGWLTDRLTRTLGLRWGRRLPMASTRFLAMAAYLMCLFLETPVAFTIAFCVVAVATDLGTPSVWAFKQDIGGRYVGAVLGWGNMWGNLGAFVSPIVLTWIIGPDRWDLCFIACAAAFALAGIAALGVDATSRLQVTTPDDPQRA